MRLDAIEQTLNEWFEKSSQLIETRLHRIEELLLLDAMDLSQSAKAISLRDTIQLEHDKAHLQTMLIEQTRQLHKYQQRRAQYGIDVPVWIEVEIEKLEASIDTLRRELDV